MTSAASHFSAIVGCGPTGCFVLNLLRQSGAKANLLAVADDEGSLGMAGADQKVLAKPGEKPVVDIGAFEQVFLVLDPSEEGSVELAKAVSSQAAEGAFVFALLLSKPGNSPAAAETARLFGGSAVVDADWVMKKRGDNDEERALQIAFNFTAHTLTFLAAALDSGSFELTQFREITSRGVSSFAATHVTEVESLYNMTMSRIESEKVKSGFVFIEATTDDVLARRIFLRVAAGLPRESNLSMLRLDGLAPFKILAMLVQ